MIDTNELKIEVYSTRHGGQSVGIPPSGVKIIHLPTGITASCHAARSQVRNRDVCMDMIESALTNPKL